MVCTMKKDNFKQAMSFIAEWEWGNRKDGHYTNHPSDPGGETKFGISKKAYPEIDIKSLTLLEAEEIYKKDYWFRSNCDTMEWPLAMSVFDASINCGVRRAREWLGKSVVAENDARRNATLFNQERIAYYNALVEKKPSLKVFHKGWLNRVNDLGKFIDISKS